MWGPEKLGGGGGNFPVSGKDKKKYKGAFMEA